MDFDEWKAAYLVAFKVAGHDPIMDEDGDPDWFAMSGGYHNGLGCIKCDYSPCCHCTAIKDIEPCGQKGA